MHGILGTPRQFDALMAGMKNVGDVIAPWLPGHGGDARAFAKSGMVAWQAAVHQAVSDACRQYERVYLVGHSMGGLLLARAALEQPKVSGLLLIAMPLRFRFSLRALKNSLTVAFTRRPCVARAMCGVRPRPLAACLCWFPRYLELYRKAREIRGVLPGIKPPVQYVYFARDELCAPASARLLPAGSRVMMLPESGHFDWTAAEIARMAETLAALITEKD